MLARIVEDWLTSAGERGYEAAFAQVLVSEGYRLLHAAVHHPFEHGKDIVGVNADGQLHAFQLKGGDIGLRELDDIQGQLLTLATTAVRYPGVEPPRLPDRVFLVTSGRLTPPARDRIAARNDAVRAAGGVPIEVIERDQMVGRLVAAHAEYLPRELETLSELLQFVLSSGSDPFPIRRFAALLSETVTAAPVTTPLHARRALAAATIFTSYATGPWERRDNHLAVAEAWLILAFTAMWVAEKFDLEESVWIEAFQLARDTARYSLNLLVREACSGEDLVVPDIVDGLVYPARACVVCGYAAAMLISESLIDGAESFAQEVRTLLTRELPYVRAHGEPSAAPLILIATALDQLGEYSEALTISTFWVRDLTARNAPDSESAVPDPYHSIPELLLREMGAESEIDEEDFAGHAYTLHVFIDWLARRGARPVVEKLWPAVTRIQFCEFEPSFPFQLLTYDDPNGETHTWAPNAPQSWSSLEAQASCVSERALPIRLWQHAEMIPYLPLLFPYRLTAAVGKAIDYLAVDRCTVEMDDEPESGAGY